MASRLIIIRGPPASGKSSLARSLAEKIKGKAALLTVDDFRWIMTVHKDRDSSDYEIAFDNFLYALENYLKNEYTVVAEDCWVRKHKDKSTSISRVLEKAKRHNTNVHRILLKAEWQTVKSSNAKRPMVLPTGELREIYDKVYSKNFREETAINIDEKKPYQVLKEALEAV